MTMQLETLTIGLKNPYSPVSETNKYVAILKVKYDDTSMTVKISEDATIDILRLVSGEVAAAARKQIEAFTDQAIAINTTAQIEGKAL